MSRLFSHHQRWKHLIIMAVLFTAISLLSRCEKDRTDQAPAPALDIAVPPGWPEMSIPEENQPTAARIALGRKLYYDSILGNGAQACASCHHQEMAFTSARGAGQMPVLPHANLGWTRNFMWDGSEPGTLEEVMLFEVQSFFGTDINLLRQNEEYPKLFDEAYGSSTIHAEDVALALAQFVRTMISARSKYDRVMNGELAFTEREQRGWELFNRGDVACFHCHTPPLFSNDGLHNTGLDTAYTKRQNWGYYAETGDSLDLGRFRTPSLRNVALRPRYMHDGRFGSLAEVLAFYNEDVIRHSLIDPLMVKPGQRVELQLTSTELEDLEAFLRTLTDTAYTQDPQWSSP